MDLCWQIKSLLFNILSRLVITFLPSSKHLLISWLQSPSAVILEPPKIVTVSTVSPSICPGCSVNKKSSRSAGDTGDMGLIPWQERYSEGGCGIPSQDSCLENPIDRGAWGGYSPQGHKELDTTEESVHAGTSHKIDLIFEYETCLFQAAC